MVSFTEEEELDGDKEMTTVIWRLNSTVSNREFQVWKSLILSSLPSVLFIHLTSLRAWSVHGKGLMDGNVAFPNPNFSLSLSYSQDHHLLFTQFSMYWHQDIMYLLTSTHTWNSRLDTVLFSLQTTVVISLSCTAHIRNSCLPSIQTYRKPGTSSDLRWPRLPQSLAWVNVVSLWLHTTSLPSVAKSLVNVNQSTPLVLTEPFVGGSSFVFVKDEALARVCRLLWSLLSYQLPFFHLLLYHRELTRVAPAIWISLGCSSLLWLAHFLPWGLKMEVFPNHTLFKVEPFPSILFWNVLCLSRKLNAVYDNVCFLLSFSLGLTHPTPLAISLSGRSRASVSCIVQVTICCIDKWQSGSLWDLPVTAIPNLCTRMSGGQWATFTRHL